MAWSPTPINLILYARGMKEMVVVGREKHSFFCRYEYCSTDKTRALWVFPNLTFLTGDLYRRYVFSVFKWQLLAIVWLISSTINSSINDLSWNIENSYLPCDSEISKQRSSASARAALLIFFTGKRSDARLLKWGNTNPTHTAAKHIKIQDRETSILFSPSLVWILGSILPTRWKEYPAPKSPSKKVTEKDFIFFQMTEFKWTRSATENVFSLNCLRQKERNKHILYASFCYSSVFWFAKMELV